MSVHKQGAQGDEVTRIQERLKELDFYRMKIDGNFGPGTEAAVRMFQADQGLVVDGEVGPNTWNVLFPQPTPPTLAPSLEISTTLLDFHSTFEGGVEWRLTPEGIEVAGTGLERTSGEPQTARRVWSEFGDSIEKWAAHYQVPCELIMATICTETGGRPDKVREEPGYTSDEDTPHRVSPGLMQTLISTAREALRNEVPEQEIDRVWLLNPDNSIRAGTAYIASQKPKTNFDPPQVACAYNAGGVYLNEGSDNRWKMRQYPIGTAEHADRFVKWLNDFFSLTASGEIQLRNGFFE